MHLERGRGGPGVGSVAAAGAGSWSDVTNRKSAGREALADVEVHVSGGGKYCSCVRAKLRLMWNSVSKQGSIS